MVHNVVGKPVQGEDFFDREAELRQLWREVQSQHILLVAPRRVGKTSLLHALVRHAATVEGARAVYVSVAKATSELGFVERLYQEVAQTPEAVPLFRKLRKGPLGRFFARVKTVTVGGVGLTLNEAAATEWQDLGQHLATILRQLSGHWYLLVDELPLFVLALLREDPGGGRARRFLHWFRDLRQGEPTVEDRLHWVLAGSIGLDAVAQRHRLGDTINDLRIMTLGPFAPADADRFLVELARSHELALPAEGRRRLCELADWLIPYHLQLLFATLRERCEDHAVEAIPSVVDAAFEDLLSPTRRAYFDFWHQRLTDELGAPHDALARHLLTACARDPVGCTRATLGGVLSPHVTDPEARGRDLLWLLDVLQNDGYLVEDGAEPRYRYRSNLLRHYWLRRFP